MPPPRVTAFDPETLVATIVTETGETIQVDVSESPTAAELVADSPFSAPPAPPAPPPPRTDPGSYTITRPGRLPAEGEMTTLDYRDRPIGPDGRGVTGIVAPPGARPGADVTYSRMTPELQSRLDDMRETEAARARGDAIAAPPERPVLSDMFHEGRGDFVPGVEGPVTPTQMVDEFQREPAPVIDPRSTVAALGGQDPAAPGTTEMLGDMVARQAGDIEDVRQLAGGTARLGDPATTPATAPAAAPAAPGRPVGRPMAGGGRGGTRTPGGAAAPEPSFPEQLAAHEGPLVPGEGQSTPLQRQLGHVDDRRRLAQQQAEQMAGAAIDRQGILDGALQRREELEMERERAVGDATRRYRSALDRVQAMEVRPDRWFAERGAFGAIGAAIAVGLGAVGQGLAGGTNVALGLIQQAVDRDIQAQMSNIDNAQSGLSHENNLLHLTRQEFDDRGAAEEMARSIMLEQAAQRVAQFEADLQGQEAAIAAGEMRDQLIQQSQAAAAAAQQAEVDRALERARALADLRKADAEARIAERRASRIGGGGGAAPGVTQAQMTLMRSLMEAGATLPEAARDARIPPEVAATFTNAPISGEGRTRIDSFEASVRHLEEAIAPYRAQGEQVPGVGLVAEAVDILPLGRLLLSEEGQRIRQIRDGVIDAFVRVRSGAQSSEHETERLVQVVRGAGTLSELMNGIEIMRREVDTVLGRGGRRGSVESGAADRDASLGVTPRG